MSDKWTFETAFDFWRRHVTTDLEAVWDRFVSAEAFLLDHKPGTPLEADGVFEVLLEQGSDGRGDGRDRRALQRLRAYVRGLPQALAAAA
ncbi:hypothetical protein [Brevundimonas sp.]|uniref:hypothetical protein n=1 Tax=Brevundimonas sp. TaxID=1871086 RepID=UPI002D253D64|nr:hypothetical protein [Brevundimonas sp.]HYC74678.1 hypothetical protein [Brevundimonas sp.]